MHDLDDEERRSSYAADITYGTNNEFGFDYLRDNMKFRLEDCVQRGHHFAIVDEVDSILIDEARTPLIISGPSEESTDKYYKINRIIPKLMRGEEIKGKEPGESYTTGDYTVDEKHRSAALTEEGIAKVEKLLGCGNLYQPENWSTLHHVQQALKAHVLFQRDKDYLVQDGQVIIVDEFTGRVMPGRRWSDGLHQAIEAKENVKIERENQTLATITFQNYFRMYKKLAGMTGTAETEAAEFEKTYKLDVIVIPTNRPMVRKEYQDIVYRTEEEKFRNAAKEIQEAAREGPAGAGGHHLGRKIRTASPLAEEDGRQARSLERQESRARSVHHRAGRPQRRRHRVHQHGRPRHRHSAGRQSGIPYQGVSEEARTRIRICPDQPRRIAGARRVGRTSVRASGPKPPSKHDEVVAARRAARARHRTARIAAHRQSAPRTRRPPGRSRAARASTSRCKTT